MTGIPAIALEDYELAQLPSDDDVRFYERHGWYVTDKVLSDEAIDRAREGAKRLYRGERDMDLPVASGFSNWKPEDGDTLRNNEFASLQIREIDQLIREPVIGAIAARLARTKSIRLLDDQLVYKPPRDEYADRDDSDDTIVGWHADHAYWATCSSSDLLTAWIPFHDVDEDRGPLVVMDGSHKWTDLEHSRFFNNTNLAEVADIYRDGRELKPVSLTLKKGQVSFHHCWTLHASLANRSDRPRLALAAHLQDEANAYRQYRNDSGQEIHIFDETLCRRLPNGDPDFSDPKVFPTLWSESGLRGA